MHTRHVDKEWFLSRFQAVQLSLREVARRLGMDASSLSRTLSGKRRLQFDEAGELAKILDVPMREVSVRAGMDWRTVTRRDKNETIPLAGTVDATNTVSRVTRVNDVLRPPGMQENVEALVYQTAQTKADTLDGWTLYVETEKKQANPDGASRLSLITLPSGREIVGFTRRGLGPNTYQVWSLEGPLLHDTAVQSVSRVLWIQP